MAAARTTSTGIKKLFIGYKTRALDRAVVEGLMPEFQANRALKDPQKIEEDLKAKREAFLAEAKDTPYLGTFDQVVIIDPAGAGVATWSFDEKRPVSVRIGAYLTKQYPTAWVDNTHAPNKLPEVVFIGFGMRAFLKMLGLECSMPAFRQPLPLKLWYSNSDHRDIEEAVIPGGCGFEKRLTLATVLKARRPVDPGDAVKWDAVVTGWKGPGDNPEKDARLALELAGQLGFMRG